MGRGLNGRIKWDFPNIRVPYFGVLIIRILLFRARQQGPQHPETPRHTVDDINPALHYGP